MTNSLSMAVHAIASCVLMSFSVDETLLPRYVVPSICFQTFLYRHLKLS